MNSEDLQTAKYLTKENMKSMAPSIFAEKPSNEVSKHYTHIPTTKVIDDMEMLGWKPIDAMMLLLMVKMVIQFTHRSY